MKIEKKSKSLEIGKSKEVPDKWSVEVRVIPHEDLVYEMQFVHSLGGKDFFVEELTASSSGELDEQVKKFVEEIKKQYHSFVIKQAFLQA